MILAGRGKAVVSVFEVDNALLQNNELNISVIAIKFCGVNVTNCYQLKMLAPDGKIRRSTHLILIPTAAEKNENNHIKRIKRLWSLAPPTGRLRISEKRTKLV